VLLLLAALSPAAAYSSKGPSHNTWTDKKCVAVPLCNAAMDGKLPALKQLLKNVGSSVWKSADVNEQNFYGRTALMQGAIKSSRRCWRPARTPTCKVTTASPR